MKILMCQIITALSLTCACAQNSTKSIPPWKVTINVIDETGQPVTNADVEVSYYVKPPPGQSVAGEKISGLTDTNGTFTASHEDTRSAGLGFKVTKDGYYPSSGGHTLYMPGQFDDKKVAANRNPRLTFILKQIEKPIPMYAKSVNLGMPVFDKQAGFDLMSGDWVAPYGKGSKADIVFIAHRDKRSEYDSDYKLIVSFPNQGDGIREFVVSELEKRSALRSSHVAPIDGYQTEWVQTSVRRPKQPIQTNRDIDRNYFFRVRTVLDEKGNVKSALYGKIYGDFMQFRYYLNPTPNSRNIEFDPKQNLLTNLKSFEGVHAP